MSSRHTIPKKMVRKVLFVVLTLSSGNTVRKRCLATVPVANDKSKPGGLSHEGFRRRDLPNGEHVATTLDRTDPIRRSTQL